MLHLQMEYAVNPLRMLLVEKNLALLGGILKKIDDFPTQSGEEQFS